MSKTPVWPFVPLLLSLAACGGGAPSVKQCRDTWQRAPSGEKVLECRFEGGERATHELGGRTSPTPVGTCWDYNVVVAQRCGCREFLKASICCRSGSTSDCEWRIGNSVVTDCAKYGEPPFGLSGSQEPADCRERRLQGECFQRKDLLFAGVVVGPCMGGGVRFTCPGGDADQQRFLQGQCGPRPEDCGCQLVPEFSTAADLECYRAWSTDEQAVACFRDRPSGYERTQCYEELLKSRAAK